MTSSLTSATALFVASLVASCVLATASEAAAGDYETAVDAGEEVPSAGEPAEPDGEIDGVIIPLVAYTPETSFLATGIGMVFSGDQDAPNQWRGTVAGAYTLNNQMLATVHYGLRLDEDRYRLAAGASVANWPEEFYGIGPVVLATSEELDVLRTTVRLRALRRIAETPLYVGLLQETEVRESGAPEQGRLASFRANDLGLTQRIGMGLRLLYDTRDSDTGTRSGVFMTFDALVFQKLWGSSTDYARIGADARMFIPLGEHVLAGQAMMEARLGEAPYYDLGALGGGSLLRGIFEGRYRDERMAAVQTEYRSPLIFWRIGTAVFGGLGMVAPTIDAFDLDHLEWAAGGGIRVLLLEERNLNLRLDYAASADDTGFYLSIGEAF